MNEIGKMRALVSVEPGGPESLRYATLDKPVPAAGELLVAVRACGLNFPDTLIIKDRYQLKPPRPFAPGAEISGVIEGVGEGVTEFREGMRVFGSLGFGGLAEYALLRADRCMALPNGMAFEDGASFLITYLTALHALKDRGGIREGETVLVLGGAGGAGTAAIQVARAMGARVIAAASSQAKLAFCIANGAEGGVVYPAVLDDAAGARGLATAFKEACGDTGADLIFDPVGGAYAQAALRAIAWHGRYLIIGFTAGIPDMPLNLVLLKASQLIGVFAGGDFARAPASYRRLGDELGTLYADRRIKPPAPRIYSFSDAAAAIAQLDARRAMGKLVVTVNPQ